MSRPEARNPFQNARLIGVNFDPVAYHAANKPRGTPEFTMSRGALADFLACPAKWVRSTDTLSTPATRWGTLMDTLVLTPDRFEDLFAVYPATYPCEPTSKDPRTEKPWSNASNFAKQWKAEHAGRIFLHREKFDDDGEADEETKTLTLGNAQRAKSRLMGDEQIRSLLEASTSQVMCVAEYHDRPTGLVVPFKILLDLVPRADHPEWGKCLADFKTARDASEREFTKAIHNGFYDWQAAIYRAIYTAATGEDRTDFLFAVQENTPPYQPALWSIGSDWMDDCLQEVRQALQFYCACLAANHWPGYRANVRIAQWGLLAREAWMLRDIPRPEPVTAPEPPPEPETKPPLHDKELVP